MTAQDSTATRPPLTRARVLQAAVALADREGLRGLTMRSLAREVGIEAMSLYHHVANKEDLLDGVVDAVAGEIADAVAGLDTDDVGWKDAMRRQILTARAVLLEHKWAPEAIESRTSFSPHVVRYYDSLIGLMRRGGFSWDLAHHAMHALGSRALGFSQELFEPDGGGTPGDDAAADDEATAMLEQMASEAPNIVAMVSAIAHEGTDTTLGWCDEQTEFEFALDVILDGLERLASR